MKSLSQRAVAEIIDVSQGTISNIALGRYWKKRTPNSFRNNITIVNDPAEEGAFPKGAKFSYTELECMLNYNSFTPGTKINIKQDQRELKAGTYIINGKEMKWLSG